MKYETHEAAKIFPMLAKVQLRELADSIAANGQRDPIVLYRGLILDGRNRLAACELAGVAPRFETRDDITSPTQFVLDVNLHRRHLNESQRGMVGARVKPLFEAEARERRKRKPVDSVPANLPEQNARSESREAAARAVNVSARTVESAATVIERGAPALTEAVDAGRVAVSTAATIAAGASREEQTRIVAQSDAEILRAARDIKRVRATARAAKREEDKARAVALAHPLDGDAFRLLVGDLEEQGESIPSDSIDAIITDPPYPEEFLPVFEKLARLAARVLRPSGHCLVMVGQSHLPALLPMLTAQLRYQWTLAYYTPGQSTQVFGRRIKSNWKPVLWFTKGRLDCEHVEDIVRSDENDKRFHKWGQSVGGMAALVERFTVRGATVLDPFVGGGATAIAATRLQRLFIGIDIDEACARTTAARLAQANEVAA